MYIIEMHAKVESEKDKFNLEDIINICFAIGIKNRTEVNEQIPTKTLCY